MIPVLDLEKDLIDQFEDIRVFLFEKDKLFKRFFFSRVINNVEVIILSNFLSTLGCLIRI